MMTHHFFVKARGSGESKCKLSGSLLPSTGCCGPRFALEHSGSALLSALGSEGMELPSRDHFRELPQLLSDSL